MKELTMRMSEILEKCYYQIATDAAMDKLRSTFFLRPVKNRVSIGSTPRDATKRIRIKL